MASTTTTFTVDGKTAIITGAGSGINLAFAALLLSRNCNVVLADLALRPEAEALLAKHSSSSSEADASTHRQSPRAIFVPTDVASWPALAHMFAVALETFDSIDIVCPGAGIFEPHWTNFWHPPGSPEARDDPVAGHYALLDINLTHPIRTTQLALSHWLHPRTTASSSSTGTALSAASSPKRIVHITSIAGQLPNLNAPLYSAAKFGLTGFVRSLGPLEAQLNIRVNAVAPGIVRTPLWEEHPEKMVYVDPDQDGWVTPAEVAAAMLRCVEDQELEGGTVLEVGKNTTRRVQVLGDAGPSKDPRDGMTVSNAKEGHEMVWAWLKDGKIWGDGASVAQGANSTM
ncbi:short chain dehydrogenase [Coniella lustricola]|uniref:Short chain dehydrogenase n=1 Tax=Coniella lustricola TaxID=2025994 RepID=A0A2T2ZV26_9PEZI|nr:short chain dehydrogenase [Coniella lustricola]